MNTDGHKCEKEAAEVIHSTFKSGHSANLLPRQEHLADFTKTLPAGGATFVSG
jgi:hypothetical protein